MRTRPLLGRRVVAVAAAALQAAADDVRYAAVQADKVGPVVEPVRLGEGAAPIAAGIAVEVRAGVLGVYSGAVKFKVILFWIRTGNDFFSHKIYDEYFCRIFSVLKSKTLKGVSHDR